SRFPIAGLGLMEFDPMKQVCALICVFAFAGMAFAQESDVTYETKTTTTVSSGADLIAELWAMDDANPIATGQVDLRFTTHWITSSAPANFGDSDDDFIFEPSLRWGACSNVEVFASVPMWLGDSGDRGAFDYGNFDTYVGFTWRFAEPQDMWPAMALGGTARIPTGDDSNGVDGELRLIMTNEYDSGIRSHFNAFAATINNNEDWSDGGFFGFGGDDFGDPRHLQYGFVVGLDGPLCGDGAVRWVADYMNRSSYHYGSANLNMLELGWEWAMAEAQKLGMSVQIGLDDENDTPNVGASLSYAWSLMY
ncbi:MAG: hypothetical protein PVI86_06600, partial [Phycisphaerae bacterium]